MCSSDLTTPKTESSNFEQKNHTTKSENKSQEPKKMSQSFKEAWQEIRSEEKTYPFTERHKNINKNIHRKYYPYRATSLQYMVYGLKNGILHVSAELVYQLEKDRKSTRLNSSHVSISYAVFCLKKKKNKKKKKKNDKEHRTEKY